MKRIRKTPRAKSQARPIESKNAANATETTRFKWMTSSHAIVLGMIFVVVTAALLTAREDMPQPAVEHEELTAMAATVENNTPRAVDTKKPAAVNKTPATPIASQTPAASMTQAAEPQPDNKAVATITGCLENDEGTFQLTEASGADAPTARSWKSGFLKKRAAHVEIVDAVGLNLRQYNGRRVAVTGTLVERDMRARSVRLIGACD